MHRLICWQVWRQQQALGRSCRAEMQLEPEKVHPQPRSSLLNKPGPCLRRPPPPRCWAHAPFASHGRDLQTGGQQNLTLCVPK